MSASGRSIARREPASRSTFCCASPTTSSRGTAGLRRLWPGDGCGAGSRIIPGCAGNSATATDGRPDTRSSTPIEQYDEADLDALAGLCRLGLGEVEIHLHHDGDTSENLRADSADLQGDPGTAAWAARPGSGERGTAPTASCMGIWALDNSRPDGRWCGVNDELEILAENRLLRRLHAAIGAQTRPRRARSTASTMPSTILIVPSPTTGGPMSGPARFRATALMIIQGPSGLDWRQRKWGFFPRIENGCLQGNQPPALDRLDAWLKARVQIPARPDWYFVKLHTHGAPEGNQRVLLGEPMVRVPSCAGPEGRRGSALPFPLRDGPGDVQPGPRRRSRLAGNGRRSAGLRAGLQRGRCPNLAQ